jgi:putative transposase
MMERAGKLNNQNINWQLWQQHNKPIELFTFAVIKQKLDNLHNNPVEVGFVAKASDWIYGSAIDYAGGKGLIDVKLLYE